MAHPVVESTATTFNGGGPDFSANLPTGVASGDLLVLVVEMWQSGGGGSCATPSGYTRIGTGADFDNVHIEVFTKVAGSSEASPSIDGTATFGNAHMTRLSNATSVGAGLPGGIGDGVVVVTPTTTPDGPAADSLLLAVAGGVCTSSLTSTEAGWTNVTDVFNGGTGMYWVAAWLDTPDLDPEAATFTLTGGGGAADACGITLEILSTVPCVPPVNDGGTGAPSVSGTPEVGETLTVDEGTWTGDATITFTYQWYRLCGTFEELLTGETATTYVCVEDDVGCDLFCEVTGANGCSPDGVADTASVGPVTSTSPPANTSPPVVSGAPFSGHTLVVDPGTWTGTPTFAYQWQIDCGTGWEDLVGETSTSLLLTDEMIGCSVRCVVTATNAFGDTAANSNEIEVEANVPAATRFCQGPIWRFVVTDLDCQVLTYLDRIATSKTAVYTLNAPAVATGIVPSDSPEISIDHTDGEPFLSEGTRMLFGFRQETVAGVLQWVVRYGGIIMQLEDIADSDNSNTHYTAFDPLKYLFSRPVQTIDGDPVGQNGLSFTATQVDVIIGTLLLNTIVNNGSAHIDMGAAYGGTGFYTGTIEALPQIDINFQQGLSVGDAFKQLTDQNLCDLILTPVWDPENRPGTVCELSVFAQAGAVQEDAIFAWDKPSRSLVGISRLLEGTARANNVRYFAGQGGSAGSYTTVDAASVTKYGEYWSQQFWPGQKVLAAVEALADAALNLQKNGKETVTISPIPGCTPLPFQEYFLGDRVPVYASNRFRQAIPSGPVQYQRIYGMPIDIEDDSTEMIKQMLTSVMQ